MHWIGIHRILIFDMFISDSVYKIINRIYIHCKTPSILNINGSQLRRYIRSTYCIQGFFSPFYSWFRPVMNSPRHSCIEREVISEILISLNIYRLVFNSPADNDTNEAKIKQVQFPWIQYFIDSATGGLISP